jgi:hypothetical protein
MGRPLVRQRYFNSFGLNHANAVHQIQSSVWGTNDTGPTAGYLISQNSDNRFGAHTVNGNSTVKLVNTAPAGPGQATVKLFDVGTDPKIIATATANLKVINASVVIGGANYHVGDNITLQGGTFGNAANVTVATVNGTAIATVTAAAVANQGYRVLPANIAGMTGIDTTNANGHGAIFSVNFGLESVTVTNNGNGYVLANAVVQGALVQPTTTVTVTGGNVASVAVGAAGWVNVNPVVAIEPTNDAVDYVKRLSARRAITWSGNVVYWISKGESPHPDFISHGLRFAYLDTL